MPDDMQVSKLVWDGKVPVCFILSPDDLAQEDRIPPPVYVNINTYYYFFHFYTYLFLFIWPFCFTKQICIYFNQCFFLYILTLFNNIFTLKFIKHLIINLIFYLIIFMYSTLGWSCQTLFFCSVFWLLKVFELAIVLNNIFFNL